MKNAIIRELAKEIRDFLNSLDEVRTIKRIYVENDFGWQMAIPVYSNNSDYGFHVISVLNVEMLSPKVKNEVLKQMMNELLPKLPLPGYMIEGHTRVFIVDKVNGKFLRARFNRWRNEAYLFFVTKAGGRPKGLGELPIMLRIAKILASFFAKRAERMEEIAKALYGTWIKITQFLKEISAKLLSWVNKLARPEKWDSRKKWEAREQAQERAEKRAIKEEWIEQNKKPVIKAMLEKIAWLTSSDATLDIIWKIAELENLELDITREFFKYQKSGVIKERDIAILTGNYKVVT